MYPLEAGDSTWSPEIDVGFSGLKTEQQPGVMEILGISHAL